MGEAAAAGLEKGNASAHRRENPRVIAVDGSAASGKSTIGRELARLLGYRFLDTGIMYRAITRAAIERGVPLTDDQHLTRLAQTARIHVRLSGPGSDEPTRVLVDGTDVTDQLRGPEVEEGVSLVSRVPGVREALVRRQREIAGEQPVVMAGRDIGTAVLPDADLKVYLDAPLQERARRRYEEFAKVRPDASKAMVLEDLRRRDQLDSERAVSPLRPAEDAIIIDTDGLSESQVLERVLALVGASR